MTTVLKAMIAAAALLAAPVSLSAQDSAPAEKPAKEKKICKLQEQGSTSRMRKKVCRTVAEWEESRRNDTSANDLRRMGGQ